MSTIEIINTVGKTAFLAELSGYAATAAANELKEHWIEHFKLGEDPKVVISDIKDTIEALEYWKAELIKAGIPEN